MAIQLFSDIRYAFIAWKWFSIKMMNIVFTSKSEYASVAQFHYLLDKQNSYSDPHMIELENVSRIGPTPFDGQFWIK